MSAEAVIGTTFTFQVLFVDENDVPITVNDPEIDIYYFDDSGDRVDIVIDGPMPPVVPAETGRYVFPIFIVTTFEDGDTIYGLMRGTNPGTGLTTHVEETLDLVSSTRASGGGSSGCRMTASFIKGGGACT